MRFRAQFQSSVAATRSARAALATRAVRFKLDHINREYNATNKEVAKNKMVRPRPGTRTGRSGRARPDRVLRPRLQAKEDASAEIAACEEIDKRRIAAEACYTQRRAVGMTWSEPLTPQCCGQAEEKVAEKAVNEALLKLGNIVHDSVHVDNNEARAVGALFNHVLV